MGICVQDYAARPTIFRRAIEEYRAWIESKLGTCLSGTVVLEIDTTLNLSDAALAHLLGYRNPDASKLIKRLISLLTDAEMPPHFAPILSLQHPQPKSDLVTLLDPTEGEHDQWSDAADGSPLHAEWEHAPVAMKVKALPHPIIAMNVHHHTGPDSCVESVARLVIARKDCVSGVIGLLASLLRRDRVPRLHTFPSPGRDVIPCKWNQVVLAPEAVSLLKQDFESFFQRQSWFREKGLPFRRGYLLHGPPGNGKTTAIRAMMTSRGLQAYTLRFFDPNMDDNSLEKVFERALQRRPAMILLEDLDRAFPKAGETRSKISLQQLLNCLDGVGTGEGIIVVATANEPSILDPAILRRPGRFDRVVHFPNPNADLRLEYFRRLLPDLQAQQLEEPVEGSEGFSFAQLREAYIMAGQYAFDRDSEITPSDILAGISSLRDTAISSSRRGKPTGFRAELMSGVTS